MKFAVALFAVAMLAACSPMRTVSTANAQSADVTAPTQPDVSSLPLMKFAHEDLQSAASLASSGGYPGRAGVYLAIDAQKTECEKSIAAWRANPLPTGGTPGVFTLFEIGAEAIAGGIPASVKLNCSAIQLPTGILGLVR